MTAGEANRHSLVVAVDPGLCKCGIAAVESSTPPRTVHRCVVPTADLIVELANLFRGLGPVDTLVIGNGTRSATLRKAIAGMFPDLPIAVVDEHGSSERARRQYLISHPPMGWKKLVPIGLRTPDRAYDDLAAEILATDYLSKT
jgi:RNase H-fold protein (predicted Holliday junction resolvase)